VGRVQHAAAALRETSSVGFSINLPLSFHSTTAALSFVETFVVEMEAAAGRLIENPAYEVLVTTLCVQLTSLCS
jgi:hypothetical protein